MILVLDSIAFLSLFHCDEQVAVIKWQVILIKGCQCLWQCAMHVGCKQNTTSRESEQAGRGWLANTLIAFHSLSPLISLGFWGNALFNPPYVAEVYTR